MLALAACQSGDRLLNQRDAAEKSVSQWENLRLRHPQRDAAVSSPLLVAGEARGRWFFEGSFPMRVRDGNGQMIGEGYVTAQGEWMTPDFVPFRGEIRFERPSTEAGTLILKRANASGLPQHDEEVVVGIRSARE
jgi:hypothetical protein